MSAITLRDYQTDAKKAIRKKFIEGHNRVLLIGATGFGKTETVASIIESTVENDKRVMFLADRISLVNQTSERLFKCGINHGVIQADNSFNRSANVLVCSQQTLEKRGYIDNADLIILDECHTQRVKIIEMLKSADKHVIGLTATPFSPGMGNLWQATVTGASTQDLQKRGWLVPLRCFIAKQIDHSKLKMNNGEITAVSAADAASGIVGDIVSEWVSGTYKHFGKPVKTLCYVPTVAYGRELATEFMMAGYSFRQVSYKQTPDQNKRSIEALGRGEIDGLISVEALVKGIDIPEVQYLVVARRYSSSLQNHVQMLGRGMRACEDIGKKYCAVNDHVGNIERFASEAESFWASGEWDLSWNEKKRKKSDRDKDEVEARERKCHQCNLLLEPEIKTCPACGYQMPQRKSNISVAPGEMTEYVPGMDKVYELNPGINLWNVVCSWAIEKRGYADIAATEKLAKAMHKTLSGRWPKWGIELNYEGEYDPSVFLICERQYKSYLKKRRKRK